MRVCPTSNEKLPKLLLSTGAVTKPNYNLNNRIGRIALHDHEYGAAVVEVINDKIYHVRMLSALGNGNFYDFDTSYKANSIEKNVSPEAIIPGDWHPFDTNEVVKDETLEIICRYKPKIAVLHDFFNARSMNHHDIGKIINQYNSLQDSNLSLEDELSLCVEDIKLFQKANPNMKIVIVKSNHDEALFRYLNEGRFMKEPQNVKIGSYLLNKALYGKDPLKEGLEKIAEKNPYDFKNVYFLQRDDDFRVKGFYLSNHGDKGANGTPGSKFQHERNHGKSIVAHGHSPFKYGDTFGVGTSTNLILPYNKGGTSSWLHTFAMIYKNGKAQLCNIINGYHKGNIQ